MAGEEDIEVGTVDAATVAYYSPLRAYEDCDTLLADIAAEATTRVGPYGLDRAVEFGDAFKRVQRSVAAAEQFIDDALARRDSLGLDAARYFSHEARYAASLASDLVRSDAVDPGATRWLSKESSHVDGMYVAVLLLHSAVNDLVRARESDDRDAISAALEAVEEAEMWFEWSKMTSSGNEEAVPDIAGVGGSSSVAVQVNGVEAPDFIKTDGRRMVTVSGGILTVVDVAGAQPVVTGRVDIGAAWYPGLMLHGDRAIVFVRDDSRSVPSDPVDRAAFSGDRVVIREVLLDGIPRRGRTLQIEGIYSGASVVDGKAHVVVVTPRSRLGFIPPRDATRIDLLAEATRHNRAVVAQSTLADWLPSYALLSAEGASLAGGLAVTCDQVLAPAGFAGFATLAVLTLDLDASLDVGAGVALFTEAQSGRGDVYADGEYLFATANVIPRPAVFGTPATEYRYGVSIQKFSLTSDGAAVYEASAMFPDHELGGSAVHRRDDHLFAAVARRFSSGRDATLEIRLLALEQRDDALMIVGELGDLGRGWISAGVPYTADRAYVVGDRVGDLPSIVDIDDPSTPILLAEIETPGHSRSLHPVGEDHVIWIGPRAGRDGTSGRQGVDIRCI